MTVAAILAELEALGTEQMRKQNTKAGAGKNQFGVRYGDIRKVAKKLKTDHKLALELWKTKNIDARLVAVLTMDPKALTAKQLDRLVRSEPFVHLADWLTRYVVTKHANAEALREQWMEVDHPMAARAGWSLTSDRIVKSPDGLDLVALLDRIEAEMATAPPKVQWTMNFCLAYTGIHFKKHRKRVLAIGEALGVFRDFSAPKGCTSPFAPIWVNEMVTRQSKK